ncbi:hypothetical protein CKL83_19795 [Bacillus anthracis]|nr:hypothetical protein BVB96_26990 [Bacillus anthracis]OTX48110.1 hypothetical protein BK723_22965 [Bacillus thuringiensis serovar pondicheriensis]PRC97152.1 hypothetical protein CQZ92_18110 [Bacillus cereus]AQM49043.1 hypothetical protein BZG08_27235 [Bacillus anthracis]OON48677.1 hypothetical protein B0R37_11305 [Bacillus anthracis]
MYGHFPFFYNHLYSPPKYISDFSNISAQLQLYRRFSKYISATQFISAIFIIYRLTDKKRHNIHT